MRLLIRASFFLLLVLGGCAQYEAQQQAEASARAQAAASSDDAQCRSYGTAPGSSGYIQCRMNLDNLRAQDLQQRRAAASQFLARSFPARTPTYNVNICSPTPGQVDTCSYPR